MLTFGCAHAADNPITPTENDLSVAGVAQSGSADVHDPHMLWGQWTLYFNEDHTAVDVVPLRQARLHLNALKFLESYCADCLQITKIKNNGDSTIDMTVKITHPFNGFPQYTGFDVKGIIMFHGTHELFLATTKLPVPQTCIVSWKEKGDAEVMNPDGYSYRWHPGYDSGSSLPIYNYWEGKFTSGVPNAHLNAFLNFYSEENRHVFYTNDVISQTYTIYLPPGQPVIAGYAVEACWEPPINTPVTNPIIDFPASANQTEPYFFDMVINNGDPIIHDSGCCGSDLPEDGCDTLKGIALEWDTDLIDFMYWKHDNSNSATWAIFPCDPDNPDSSYRFGNINFSGNDPGKYRDLVAVFYTEFIGGEGIRRDFVFDLVDYAIIE